MDRATLAERAAALIERNKDGEACEVARAYLDALGEIDRLRRLVAAATAAAPVEPPANSGWVLQPDGSYLNGLEVLYLDPNFIRTSGERGLWFKKRPHEERGRPVSGGPAQGFWGDDTEP
jgi:hypothetical protein